MDHRINYRRKKIFSKVMIYFALCGVSLFVIFPLLWLVRSSLMSTQGIFASPMKVLPVKPQFKNYVDVFTILPFARFFLNTAVIVVLNVIGALLSNTFIAYAFARLNFRGKKIMYMLCLSTLMLPSTVTMIPLFIEWNWLRGINTIAPLTVLSFFGNAFYIFFLNQYFKTIPKEIDEAAYMDGASHFQIIFKLIMPIAKPALAVVAIFTFMFSWNDFLGPLLYLHDIDKFTLALGLKTLIGGYSSEWHILMAAAVLIIIPLIILFFFAQRYFIKGLTFGGLKG